MNDSTASTWYTPIAWGVTASSSVFTILHVFFFVVWIFVTIPLCIHSARLRSRILHRYRCRSVRSYWRYGGRIRIARCWSCGTGFFCFYFAPILLIVALILALGVGIVLLIFGLIVGIICLICCCACGGGECDCDCGNCFDCDCTGDCGDIGPDCDCDGPDGLDCECCGALMCPGQDVDECSVFGGPDHEFGDIFGCCTEWYGGGWGEPRSRRMNEKDLWCCVWYGRDFSICCPWYTFVKLAKSNFLCVARCMGFSGSPGMTIAMHDSNSIHMKDGLCRWARDLRKVQLREIEHSGWLSLSDEEKNAGRDVRSLACVIRVLEGLVMLSSIAFFVGFYCLGPYLVFALLGGIPQVYVTSSHPDIYHFVISGWVQVGVIVVSWILHFCLRIVSQAILLHNVAVLNGVRFFLWSQIYKKFQEREDERGVQKQRDEVSVRGGSTASQSSPSRRRRNMIAFLFGRKRKPIRGNPDSAFEEFPMALVNLPQNDVEISPDFFAATDIPPDAVVQSVDPNAKVPTAPCDSSEDEGEIELNIQ